MRTFLFLLFFSLPFLAFSQFNFQPGYMINNAGDTLKGYVNYRERSVNPVSFQFKTSIDGKANTFKLENAAGYVIEGLEKFQRYKVDISLGAVNTASLSQGPDSSFKTATVFLKVLQEGKNVTLYMYKDIIKVRYYIKDKYSDVPVELHYLRYVNANNLSGVVTEGRYGAQLFSAMIRTNTGTTADMVKFRHLKYEQRELLRMVSMINGLEPVKAKGPYGRLFAGAGISLSEAEYSGANSFAQSTTENKSSLRPMLNFGVDIFANPQIGRLIYRLELSLLMSSHKFSVQTGLPAEARLTHAFDQYTLRLAPQIIYNVYNTAALKLFLGAGFGANFSTYSNNLSTRYNSIRNETTETEDAIQMNAFNVTFPLRVGAVLNKRIEIAGAFSPKSALTNYSYWTLSQKRYNLSVNYLFGK